MLVFIISLIIWKWRDGLYEWFKKCFKKWKDIFGNIFISANINKKSLLRCFIWMHIFLFRLLHYIFIYYWVNKHHFEFKIVPVITEPHPINLHLSSTLLLMATFSPAEVQTGIAKLSFIIFLYKFNYLGNFFSLTIYWNRFVNYFFDSASWLGWSYIKHECFGFLNLFYFIAITIIRFDSKKSS